MNDRKRKKSGRGYVAKLLYTSLDLRSKLHDIRFRSDKIFNLFSEFANELPENCDKGDVRTCRTCSNICKYLRVRLLNNI